MPSPALNSTLPSLWLWLRVISCTAWAASMVVIGLFLATAVTTRSNLSAMGRFDAIVCGVGLVCLGQFVFATLVADRIFPRADRRIVGMCQVLMAMGVILVCGYGFVRLITTLTAS